MDESVDRRNGNRFLWANLMIYMAAPIYYVDVTQAALCNKLGASAAVANLPAAFNLIGNASPIVFACLIPHRLERRMASLPYFLVVPLVGIVGVSLMLPFSNQVRIASVIVECLILGVLNGAAQVFMLQCLGRGTSEAGRARALKMTFTFGPIAAVAGSLGAQFVLRGGIPWLAFPRDFAFLHLFAIPCAFTTASCSSRFELEPMADEPPTAFWVQMRNGLMDFVGSNVMIRLWLAYFLWNCALYAMANLSLYTKVTIGRDPAEFSGLILALRFGTKALAGYGLGMLYLRHGFRAPLIATVALACLGMIWAWAVPGYPYLAAFGILGAAELGGVYFPNVVLSWAPAATATRGLAFMGMTTPASAPAPALYGFVTDHWGFPASFALGAMAAFGALCLVFTLPTRKPALTTSAKRGPDASRRG